MGRDSGYLALMVGMASCAEAIAIPEVPTTCEELLALMKDAHSKGKAHFIIVVAEGWQSGAQALANQLRERQDTLGFSVRVTQLGHVQRGGSASAFDRLLATRLGAAVVRELVAGNAGHMVGWVKSAITLTPLEEAVAFDKQLSPTLRELADIMKK
jgi:6-phosphofructokinase 1